MGRPEIHHALWGSRMRVFLRFGHDILLLPDHQTDFGGEAGEGMELRCRLKFGRRDEKWPMGPVECGVVNISIRKVSSMSSTVQLLPRDPHRRSVGDPATSIATWAYITTAPSHSHNHEFDLGITCFEVLTYILVKIAVPHIVKSTKTNLQNNDEAKLQPPSRPLPPPERPTQTRSPRGKCHLSRNMTPYHNP